MKFKSLRFEWRINKEDQDLLAVQPESGTIEPNEIQSHEISLKTQLNKMSHYKPLVKVTSPLTKFVSIIYLNVTQKIN